MKSWTVRLKSDAGTRVKPAMMCEHGPSTSRCLSFQPLPHRRPYTTRSASTCHLVHRAHLIAQSYTMFIMGPRSSCPLFGIDGTGRHASPVTIIVLAIVRPNGVLCTQCSLMTAAFLPVVVAKIVLHASGRMIALLLSWMTLRRWWSPLSGPFTKCANAIRRSPANT
jgi:hypothetical protein